jgi:steroid 5-alpha reductase family enzyme
MARFRADPGNRGGICDVGLWAYSRHPNYFFEWLCWLGYAVISADFTGGYPWGWLAFAAPATMYWLLVHVSGVPPLEAHLARSRPTAFKAYAARVNAFWPWPPVRRASRPRD